MPQPNKAQWRVIWVLATAVVLLWPLGDQRSLAVKGVNFFADPFHSLPVLPPPLPMALGDDADAVNEHDFLEYRYYEAYEGSPLTRMRMDLRDWRLPVDPGTQRQMLMALGVLGVLLVWRLAGRRVDVDDPGPPRGPGPGAQRPPAR